MRFNNTIFAPDFDDDAFGDKVTGYLNGDIEQAAGIAAQVKNDTFSISFFQLFYYRTQARFPYAR